jgi:hypothetical protein
MGGQVKGERVTGEGKGEGEGGRGRGREGGITLYRGGGDAPELQQHNGSHYLQGLSSQL